MKKFSQIFLVGLLPLLSGCSTVECDGLRNSMPLAGFFVSEPAPAAVAIGALTLYGIGAPGDSLLLNEASNVDEVYLPFRIESTSTSFVLDYLTNPPVSDTITFNYDLEPRLASVECGVVYDYHIKQINHTRAFIDSVVCPGGLITNAEGQNLRIYLRNISQQ